MHATDVQSNRSVKYIPKGEGGGGKTKQQHVVDAETSHKWF